jgi:hypothetical protein
MSPPLYADAVPLTSMTLRRAVHGLLISRGRGRSGAADGATSAAGGKTPETATVTPIVALPEAVTVAPGGAKPAAVTWTSSVHQALTLAEELDAPWQQKSTNARQPYDTGARPNGLTYVPLSGAPGGRPSQVRS